METRILKFVGLIMLTSILLITTSCVIGGKLRTESHSIELGGAQSVSVEINMGVGKLEVSGGADELLNADFLYRIRSWKPIVDYQIIDSRGRLIIEQPDVVLRIPIGRSIRYEWDLRLNDDIPMDLSLELGVGKSNLKLGYLKLTDLDIKMGVGDLEVDLVGEWENDLNADIECGVGKLTVLLPSDVGVHIEAERGIGKINTVGLEKDGDVYVNDAYDSSEVTLRIELEAGIGEINLKVINREVL